MCITALNKALDHARKTGIMVVHIRAVYNEQVSPWLRNFKVKNPVKWSIQYPSGKIDNDCTEEFAIEHENELIIQKVRLFFL